MRILPPLIFAAAFLRALRSAAAVSPHVTWINNTSSRIRRIQYTSHNTTSIPITTRLHVRYFLIFCRHAEQLIFATLIDFRHATMFISSAAFSPMLLDAADILLADAG